MNQTMGSVKNKTHGLFRLFLISCIDDFCLSYWDHQRESPDSWRSFAAFWRRIFGAYVSLTVTIIAKQSPARRRTTQFVHRQPRYSKTKPPMSGPKTGPLNGPRLNSDMPMAKYSGFDTSTTVPGPLDIRAAPNNALQNVSGGEEKRG